MTKSEQMYEEYGFKDDFIKLQCDSCKKIIGYSYGTLDAVTDVISFLCPSCRNYLPRTTKQKESKT